MIPFGDVVVAHEMQGCEDSYQGMAFSHAITIAIRQSYGTPEEPALSAAEGACPEHEPFQLLPIAVSLPEPPASALVSAPV